MAKITLKKIQKLSKELNSINPIVESYIDALNEIRKEHNIFTIKTIKDEPITNNLSLYSYSEVLISFNFNNEQYEFSFLGDLLTNLHKLNLTHLSKEIKFVLDLIQEKIQFEKIKRSLYSSLSLYKQIKKSYEQIYIQNTDFYINSQLIISLFKNLKKEHIIEEENYQYGYIKLKINKLDEIIEVIFSSSPIASAIKIKLPNLKEIEKIQIKNNTINSKTDYERIFKEEIIRLNKKIFNQFNISMSSLCFLISSDIDAYYTDYNNSDFFYYLSIYSINTNNINAIADKIKLNKEIANF